MWIIKYIKRQLRRSGVEEEPVNSPSAIPLDKIYHAKEFHHHSAQAERHTKLAIVFKDNLERKVHHEMQALHHLQLMTKHGEGKMK